MISCICCHYGRTWLLKEAVQSYLEQDFDQPAELIIVNDHPYIEIAVSGAREGRDIRVVNWGARMPTISHKFDFGVGLARYPLIMMWDDDDLSLPSRMADSVSEWELCGRPGYLAFDRHFYCDQRGPHLIARGLHGGDLMTKEAYNRVGGSVGAGHNDQNLVLAMKASGDYTPCKRHLAFYVYRWANVGSHHSSHLSLEVAMAVFDAMVRADPEYVEGYVRIEPEYKQETVELMEWCKKMAEYESLTVAIGEMQPKPSVIG